MKNYFGAPIKKLGFGFMRLPTLPGQPDSEIDLEHVKRMVDLYMERGFSYYDTAFVYHGGKSEEAIRVAVTERYPRDKFQVTTKLPLWGPLTHDQMKETTQTSLTRAGLDFFDLYFLHGLGPGRLQMLEDMKAWDYLISLKDSGKAKNIGFSYHGDADSLSEILDARGKDIDIVQVQLNYLDWDDPELNAKKVYQTIVDHDCGCIVMEPIKGGSLANFTPAVADVFKNANPNVSLASWALRFPMFLDGVVTTLSGMSDFSQVEDNIKTTDTLGPLNDDEQKVILSALEELRKVPIIPCTACRYCVDDCPKKINTPAILGLVNDYTKYQNLAGAKRTYAMMTSGMGPFGGSGVPARSSDCIACGECEKRCPQNIKIIEEHKKAAALLES